ncbi:MAG: hypothetical protein RIB32_03235 [Phycisphaerales bacterium]
MTTPDHLITTTAPPETPPAIPTGASPESQLTLLYVTLFLILLLIAMLVIWTLIRRMSGVKALRERQNARPTRHRRSAWEEAGRRAQAEALEDPEPESDHDK